MTPTTDAPDPERPWPIIMNGHLIAKAKAIHVKFGRTVFTGAEFDRAAITESTLLEAFRLGETLLGYWHGVDEQDRCAHCEPQEIGRSGLAFTYIRFDCSNEDGEPESLLVQVADEVPSGKLFP
jgi:hypothetical protein